mmetsp:Transcript_58995/g.110528  ORF Transcript_58995/g.110528 Transcript_58995/m.110528 type:complete len:169 (-) Transcript_58995:109-615(-)
MLAADSRTDEKCWEPARRPLEFLQSHSQELLCGLRKPAGSHSASWHEVSCLALKSPQQGYAAPAWSHQAEHGARQGLACVPLVLLIRPGHLSKIRVYTSVDHCQGESNNPAARTERPSPLANLLELTPVFAAAAAGKGGVSSQRPSAQAMAVQRLRWVRAVSTVDVVQ